MIETKIDRHLPERVVVQRNIESEFVEEWLQESFANKPKKVKLDPKNVKVIYKKDKYLAEKLVLGPADFKNAWYRGLPSSIAQYETDYCSFFYRDKFQSLSEKIHIGIHENGHGLLYAVNPQFSQSASTTEHPVVLNPEDAASLQEILQSDHPTVQTLFTRLAGEGLCEWLATEVGERYTITGERNEKSPHKIIYEDRRGLKHFTAYNNKDILMSGIATANNNLLYGLAHKNMSIIIDALHKQGQTRQEAFFTVAKNPPRSFSDTISPVTYLERVVLGVEKY
jgi:hypothetical protein